MHRASGLASSKGPLEAGPYHFGAALGKIMSSWNLYTLKHVMEKQTCDICSQIWSETSTPDMCLEWTLGSGVGDFLDSGRIVDMKLSPGWELNPEDLMRLESWLVWFLFFRNCHRTFKLYPRTWFASLWDPKVFQRMPKSFQNQSNMCERDLQNSLGFSSSRSSPKGIPELKKVTWNQWLGR